MDYFQYLQYELGENRVSNFLYAFGIFLLFLTIGQIIGRRLIHHFEKLSHRTKTKLDDKLSTLLKRSKTGFVVVVGLYTSLLWINLTPEAEKVIHSAFIIFLVYYCVHILQIVLEHSIEVYMRRQGIDPVSYEAIRDWVRMVVRIVLWTSGVLLVLSNLGFNISSLLASLGVGGIAVALASQHILSDWFSSFFIYFNKPFKIGDYIELEGEGGTVKQINLKTTHIETLKGDELIMPNSKIIASNLHNFKKMNKRRIEFDFGVKYKTPIAKLKKISQVVKRSIEAEQHTEFLKAVLKDFGPEGFVFKIIYFIDIQDYNDYLDINEKVNYRILKEVNKLKVSIVHPSTTVQIKK